MPLPAVYMTWVTLNTYGHLSSVTCPKIWMYVKASRGMDPMQTPVPPQDRGFGVQAVTCWAERMGAFPPSQISILAVAQKAKQLPHAC